MSLHEERPIVAVSGDGDRLGPRQRLVVQFEFDRHGSRAPGRRAVGRPAARAAGRASISSSRRSRSRGWRSRSRAGTGRPAPAAAPTAWPGSGRSEEHTYELQSLMRISYDVFCLTKKTQTRNDKTI